jgi:hypothetical protein
LQIFAIRRKINETDFCPAKYPNIEKRKFRVSVSSLMLVELIHDCSCSIMSSSAAKPVNMPSISLNNTEDEFPPLFDAKLRTLS